MGPLSELPGLKWIEMDFLFGDYWSSRNTFSDYQMWFLAI